MAQKFYTKTGSLVFEASVPAFEEVKAKNGNATAILDVTSGKIAVLALIKGFRFKNALMEEHFNENYMDSDKYPKATFSGVLSNFSLDDITSEKSYTVTGDLTVHGKKKRETVTIRVVKDGDNIKVTTNFTANPADFDIEIPSIVKEKISDTINIEGQFNLVLKN